MIWLFPMSYKIEEGLVLEFDQNTVSTYIALAQIQENLALCSYFPKIEINFQKFDEKEFHTVSTTISVFF
jgi:hypothetical protein